MKTLIIFVSIICLVHADSSPTQDVKSKTNSNPLNTIPAIQKQEFIYQPIKYHQQLQQQQQLQIQPQYVPIQIIPKPYYVPQPQPAMVIIAQPALLPSSLVYGSAMQQLLNYFHSNPQAKYQLLHGNQPQAAVQPTVMMHQTPVAAQSIGNYIIAAPTHYQTQHVMTAAPTAAPAAAYTHNHIAAAGQFAAQPLVQPQPQQQVTNQRQITQQQITHQQQPVQLNQIAHLAQLAAQQYASSPLRSTPPIVTGFENFTPEQQAQIKAQLGAHLGMNYHAVTAQQYSSKYTTPTQSPNDFVASQQVKNDVTTASSSSSSGGSNNNGGDILKTQYSKG